MREDVSQHRPDAPGTARWYQRTVQVQKRSNSKSELVIFLPPRSSTALSLTGDYQAF